MSDQTTRTLEDFERALLGTNPFSRGRVSEPSRSDVDVAEIHGMAFSKLKKRIEGVRIEGTAAGVMLLGGAGVGKSHLLSRLWRWALTHDVDYVFLHNVLASPERMPRYITSAIVSALANHRDGLEHSRLIGLLVGALSFSRDKVGKPFGPATIEEELKNCCREIGDGTVVGVLGHFLHAVVLSAESEDSEHAARADAALAWLRCDSLEAEQAEQLGLTPSGDDTSVEDDARAEQILCTLFDLCRANGRAFVLCVDQVDNLDDERVRALSAFFHVLVDHGRNFVLVTSGVSESMMDFKQRYIISTAAWDRVAQYQLKLRPVEPWQAREIVAARCKQFLSGFGSLSLPVANNPLFPLSDAFAREVLDSAIEFRPRDVVRAARDEWEDLQLWVEERGVETWLKHAGQRPGRAKPEPQVTLAQAIDAAIRRRVRQAVAQRRLNPGTLPPDEDNLRALTMALLQRCVGVEGYSLREVIRLPSGGGSTRAYDIEVLEQDEKLRKIRTSCTFVATQNAHRATARLKKILGDQNPPDHRLLISDEERCPLKLGPRGKEYLHQLEKIDGFMRIRFDFAAYAHLDALHTTIGDARVNDLEIEHPRGSVRFISEAECVEAMHRTGLFKDHPLLHELLTQEPAPKKPATGAILQTDYAKKVILAQVSWRLGMDIEEVTRWVMQKNKLPKTKFDAVQDTLVGAADMLHSEGKIDASPTDGGGRFVQLLVN